MADALVAGETELAQRLLAGGADAQHALYVFCLHCIARAPGYPAEFDVEALVAALETAGASALQLNLAQSHLAAESAREQACDAGTEHFFGLVQCLLGRRLEVSRIEFLRCCLPSSMSALFGWGCVRPLTLCLRCSS